MIEMRMKKRIRNGREGNKRRPKVSKEERKEVSN